MNDAFGHWFAGFTAGEGCFLINYGTRDRPGRRTVRYIVCPFVIKLRVDDAPVLREIQTQLGYGTIRFDGSRGATNPTVTLSIANKRSCAQLVELFRKYPLRAKKARDFEIWAEAVTLWCGRQQGDSIEALLDLRDALQMGRRYGEDAEPVAREAEPQLRLVS